MKTSSATIANHNNPIPATELPGSDTPPAKATAATPGNHRIITARRFVETT
jgi:hypothetical protein